jgi:hypothetical protein
VPDLLYAWQFVNLKIRIISDRKTSVKKSFNGDVKIG